MRFSKRMVKPGAFGEIVVRPKWLKIAPVEAGMTLGNVNQVEALAGPDVVNVPQPSILPCHSRQEQHLQMRPQVSNRTADQIRDSCSVATLERLEGAVDASLQSLSQRDLDQFVAPSRIADQLSLPSLEIGDGLTGILLSPLALIGTHLVRRGRLIRSCPLAYSRLHGPFYKCAATFRAVVSLFSREQLSATYAVQSPFRRSGSRWSSRSWRQLGSQGSSSCRIGTSSPCILPIVVSASGPIGFGLAPSVFGHVGNALLAMLPVHSTLFRSRAFRMCETPASPRSIVLDADGYAMFRFISALRFTASLFSFLKSLWIGFWFWAKSVSVLLRGDSTRAPISAANRATSLLTTGQWRFALSADHQHSSMVAA